MLTRSRSLANTRPTSTRRLQALIRAVKAAIVVKHVYAGLQAFLSHDASRATALIMLEYHS